MNTKSLSQRYERSKERGFSLVELLIVMSVILILMTLAIPQLTKIRRKANETSAIQSVRAIAQAQHALRRDPGNTYLNLHLAKAMRQKIELLRRANALAES